MRTKPYITLACLISRKDISRWLDNLKAIEMPRDVMEAVFLVDGSSDDYPELQSLEGFKRIITMETGNKPCSPVNTLERRKRITENMSILQGLVGDSTYVFGIEDDTYPPEDAFNKLFAHITAESVGFVSGVEVGRWELPYVGAWKVDEKVGTGKLHSLPYREDHTQQVDGAGLYCYLTRTRHFQSAKFSDTDFGPDVNYVLSLRKKKLLCLVDWSVKCGHLDERTGRMLEPDENCALVSLVKRDGYRQVVSHVPYVKQ